MTPEQNAGKSKSEVRAVYIAAIAGLITAIAGLLAVILGDKGILDILPKTATPETVPTSVINAETAVPDDNLLFFEDFQDNQHSFYSLERGIWTIQEDSDQTGNKVLQVVPTSDTESAMAVLIPNILGSYTIEFRTRFTQSNPERCFVSIMWLENHNFVISPAQGNIYAANRDTSERFFEEYLDIKLNVWYILRVAVNNNNANFFVNGRGVGSTDDISAELPHQLYFVVGEKSGTVQFDDFYVTKTGQ